MDDLADMVDQLLILKVFKSHDLVGYLAGSNLCVVIVIRGHRTHHTPCHNEDIKQLLIIVLMSVVYSAHERLHSSPKEVHIDFAQFSR